MKTIQAFLQENVKPVNFNDLLKIGKVSLTEADDPSADADAGADPLAGADPATGGDPLASGDSLAGGAGGADPLGGAPTGGEGEQAGIQPTGEEGDEDEKEKDDHEDDPDWTKGVKDTDDVTLKDKPAGESIYDGESVLKAINAVQASKAPEELKSMDEVKKALELIVNGKKLKIEDVSFEDPDDAMELISAIEEHLDIKLRNYIDLKIKQPIIAYRDQNKAEIAKMAADNDKARDTIDAMNKQEK